MQPTSRARTAGLVGMAGAGLWLLSNILEAAFGLQPPAGTGPLYVANQLLALVALTAIALGILGILWGGGVRGGFGATVVWIWAIGTVLIVVGGLIMLVLQTFDSPLLLVFPIGGTMMDFGALLTGIAVAWANRWTGWQRWMPLLYGLYLLLSMGLPRLAGITPDGPTFAAEIGQDIGLFFVALAVYTAQTRTIAARPVAVERA